eukprot:CAMPEP_0118860644 /NCGR_PEP_ID=MMETSP1163-20130328/6424_1 /TAXON_ID=124430 /ORGANISM="Phaeomonas parva, Strain CCMP2877" /LENGTH=521 /DNA_ID=CAMNT_0006794363 /DNA_START=56 /DNA_END=1618 /DNA_ORIENTATION=+
MAPPDGWALGAAAAAVAAASFVHLTLCPYTKVEESFNVQAAHDAMTYGVGRLAEWDHLQFPGVVPRSFVGSLTLGGLLAPLAELLRSFGYAHTASLLLYRGALASLGAHAFWRVADRAERRMEPGTGVLFLLLTACQFHLPFYLSRPLPNTFAFALVLHGFASWLDARPAAATAWISAALVVFRCDVAVLALPLGAAWLLRGELSLLRGVAVGLASTAVALLLTVPIDSHLWGRWLWPELEVFRFNALANRGTNSEAWGTMPPLWYFASALPRALTLSYPLALLGLGLGLGVRKYAAVALLSVGLYSALPHKELRFIFPALPLLTLSAAAVLARLARRHRRGGRVVIVGVLGACAALTAVFASAAMRNYPGGRALDCLHRLGPDAAGVAVSADAPDCDNVGALNLTRPDAPTLPARVHIDVAAAQQGVSRFGEEFRGDWTYSKAEDLELKDLSAYDYLLTAAADQLDTEFEVLRRVRCFGGLDYEAVVKTLGLCLVSGGCVSMGVDGCDIFILRRRRPQAY